MNISWRASYASIEREKDNVFGWKRVESLGR